MGFKKKKRGKEKIIEGEREKGEGRAYVRKKKKKRSKKREEKE